MEDLLILAGVVFILCCCLGKPMKLAVRGVLGLIGSFILVGLAVFGVSLLLSAIAVFGVSLLLSAIAALVLITVIIAALVFRRPRY